MDFLDRLSQEFKDAVELRETQATDAACGVLPRIVAVPQNEDAANKFVTWCGINDIALIARGGGTKIHIGAKPSRCDVILSTEKLNEVFEHDEGNATVEAGAGISLDALNAEVGKRGQFVPLDWEENSGATLGGVVAANHYGATKLRYGTPRDLVTGLHAAQSDGRFIKAGSKVVKNVSGYDLSKIFIGSFGTLGLLTRGTLRLRPNDGMRRDWNAVVSSWDEAQNLARTILNGAFEPALLRVIGDKSTLRLVARFDGSEAAVTSQLSRLPESQNDNNDERNFTGELELRAHLPLVQTAAWARAAQEQGATRVLWDCGLGVARASFEKAPADIENIVEELRHQAEAQQGFVVVERAPDEMKNPDLVWGARRGDFALQRELKKKFDAANIFAPGRLVGGL